jgi:hypothetical protein
MFCAKSKKSESSKFMEEGKMVREWRVLAAEVSTGSWRQRKI